MYPLISIIIPVYNMGELVAKCIESVIAQSYDNLEIVIVNDGSTDDSMSVCEEFVKRGANIKLFNQENQGVSAARNKGMRQAKGQYIFFLDADDELPPNAVASLVDAALKFDSDMTIGRIGPNEVIPLGVFEGDQFLQKALEDNPIAYNACRILYKREFLKDVHFMEGVGCGEDSYFVFECALKKPMVVVIEEQVYVYCFNVNSATQSSFTMKRYDDIQLTLAFKEERIKEDYPYFVPLFYHLKTKVMMMLLTNLACAKGKEFRIKEKEALACFNQCKVYFQGDLPYSNLALYKMLAQNKYQIYKICCRGKRTLRKARNVCRKVMGLFHGALA